MSKDEVISKIMGDNTTAYISLAGLVKPINEDRLEYWAHDREINVCIADGHWGNDAAQQVVHYWKHNGIPRSKEAAVHKASALEQALYESFGKPVMDEEHDRTPETAFVCARIFDNKLDVIAYGDCRLLVVNNEEVRFSLPQKSTWLGAFSYLGLRKRLPARMGLVCEQISLETGDYIIVFTDGLDECIYEKPTISHEAIAKSTELDQPKRILEELIRRAFSYGAEDNVSVLIYKY